MPNPIGRPPINRDDVLDRIAQGHKGYVFVSPIRLAEEMDVSSRSIRRILRELEAEGKIILKRREGTRSIVYEVP